MSVQAPYRTSFTVTGMTCPHCTNAVTEELAALDGVRSVDVKLSSGVVAVDSDRELTRDELIAAVREAGYSVVD